MSKSKLLSWVSGILLMGYFGCDYMRERNIEYTPIDVANVCDNPEEGHYELFGVPGSVNTDLSDNKCRISIVLGCEEGFVSTYSSDNANLRERYLQAETLINYYMDRDDTTRVRLFGKFKKNRTFEFKFPRNLDDLID